MLDTATPHQNSLTDATSLLLQGERSRLQRVVRWRLTVIAILACAGFALITGRLLQIGLVEHDDRIEGQTRAAIQASRPPLTDRNGIVMAVDIRVPSLYADPARIADVEEVVTKLTPLLPELDRARLERLLASESRFVWIARELTPSVQEQVMRLGLPGIDFLTESRRFYPGGSAAAHVLGTVDVDNRGTAGIELALDEQGLADLQNAGIARDTAMTPVALSLDMRVQHAMREELLAAIVRYRAIAAAGIMLDARTGEVLALVSLPDFDPNDPATALSAPRFNRITGGTFELGSTLKTITIAAAFDAGSLALSDVVDAREGVRFGRFLLDHGKRRVLTVPEVFKYSDNIGTIRIMQDLGKEAYRRFLSRIGFDTRTTIELPENAAPRVPDAFSDVGAATASYGYGLAITPLHMAQALAVFANGGYAVRPTLFARSPAVATPPPVRVVDASVSRQVVDLLRFNAVEGSGRRMDELANGYRAGGKTGTAEKVIDGVYSDTLNLALFTAVFPVEAPQYVLLVMLDEAKAEQEGGSREAAWNAAQVAGSIIARTAPMLGVPPIIHQK